MKYNFSEVTDLKMDVSFSMGDALGEFTEGFQQRELFIIYKGPPMGKNRKVFFEQLQQWIDKKEKERKGWPVKTFRHVKTGGMYKVIGTALVKDTKTRDWKKAIIYSAVVGEALEKQIYVRDEKDFKERFVEQ